MGFRTWFNREDADRYHDALRERIEQIRVEIEEWAPQPGVDAGTNLAAIVARLREIRTLRWVVESVPTLLTQAEEREQSAPVGQREDGGPREAYDTAAEGEYLAGEADFSDEDEW